MKQYTKFLSDKDGTYSIFEVKTNQKVFSNKNKPLVDLIHSRLSKGSGFCGETPEFFCQEFKQVDFPLSE
jgi:hypothetical protein